MDVTTASNQRPSSIPPADYGGNIDLRNLTVESTLFLPVQIEGAELYIGDPNFAQDNGEVSLTALEASLRATLRAQVVPTAEDKRLFGRTDLPFAISHGTLIPMGFSSTLDDALSQSVEHAINMITAMFEMPRQQVYLLLSAAIGICKFNGGGIQQLPAAVADDGMLDLSLIRPVHFWHLLFRFHYLFNGGIYRIRHILQERGSRIRIESSPEVSVEIDGEPLGHTPLEFSILHRAIRIVVARDFYQRCAAVGAETPAG